MFALTEFASTKNSFPALVTGSNRNFQDFLVAKNTTAFHLLSQAMDKHTGAQQLQANNNLSGMNETASNWEFAQSPDPWKKGKKTCCRNMCILA